MRAIQGVRISAAGMVGWAALPGLLAAGIGAYPTWRLAGGEGMLALLAAGVVVMAVMAASAAVVRRAAARGAAPAAKAFVLGSLIRVAMCILLSAASWQAFDLPGEVLFLWSAVLYVVTLLGEATWLARALHRHTLRLYLGGTPKAET